MIDRAFPPRASCPGVVMFVRGFCNVSSTSLGVPEAKLPTFSGQSVSGLLLSPLNTAGATDPVRGTPALATVLLLSTKFATAATLSTPALHGPTRGMWGPPCQLDPPLPPPALPPLPCPGPPSSLHLATGREFTAAGAGACTAAGAGARAGAAAGARGGGTGDGWRRPWSFSQLGRVHVFPSTHGNTRRTCTTPGGRGGGKSVMSMAVNVSIPSMLGVGFAALRVRLLKPAVSHADDRKGAAAHEEQTM